MYVFHSYYQTGDDKPGLILIKLDSLTNMISQITSIHKVAYQVYVLLVLKCIFNVHKERMSQLGQKLF